MDISLTLLTLTFGVGIIGATIWFEYRPRKRRQPSLEPSMLPTLPTTPFLLLGAVIVVLSVSHLATLIGVTH